uniref:Uncharacterized protein n=1 Tax=Glossina pallidipes TaxID=7398 RepID=A0A1B0AH31_GLOPL
MLWLFAKPICLYATEEHLHVTPRPTYSSMACGYLTNLLSSRVYHKEAASVISKSWPSELQSSQNAVPILEHRECVGWQRNQEDVVKHYETQYRVDCDKKKCFESISLTKSAMTWCFEIILNPLCPYHTTSTLLLTDFILYEEKKQTFGR